MKFFCTASLSALLIGSLLAADPASAELSAADLAARLSALQQDGSAYVRMRLEVKQPPGTTKESFQFQIKQRRTKSATEIVYQVLWPKERKGEAVLLRRTGNSPANGSLFVPPDSVSPLGSAKMKEPLFGSDLSYEDVIENFFAWANQSLAGTEVVDGVNCTILESKPGPGQSSSYARVRSWVDPSRLIPLRMEKYLASGQLARRIEITHVVTEDGRPTPANLKVRGPQKDSVTEIEGSRIRRDVTFTDREFTPEGLQEMTPPRSSVP